MDKLNGMVSLLTLMFLAYIVTALWLSRRQDNRERHPRPVYPTRSADKGGVSSR
jgi:hypothetical protein